MKSYSEENIFSATDCLALREATSIVSLITSDGCRKEGTEEDIRCHEVARVVRDVFQKLRMPYLRNMVVVDGKYRARQLGVDHSWLVYGKGKSGVILDPYSVGQLPMVLVFAHGVGQKSPYEPGKVRDDIDYAWVNEQVEHYIHNRP